MSAPVMPPKEDGGILKYVIAASVLGACIGNMFVARKMRGIMKLKVPAAESATAAGWSSPPPPHSGRARVEGEEARARQAQRVRDYNYQREQQEQVHEAYRTWARHKYDPHRRPRNVELLGLDAMTPYLQALGLPTSELPSKKEVKEAYGKIAMQSHPDRVPEGSHDRPRLQRKFTEATEAYKALLKKLDSLEGEINKASP